MTNTPFLPMHVQALGFTRNPFPYTPDADSYFLTPYLEEQIVELEHCILARKGFCLLTSEIGLGKSTLVRRLLASLQQQAVRCALVVNTFLQGPELLRAIVSDFGLSPAEDLYSNHKILNDFLLQMHRSGTTCLIVIDDAQNLSRSSLEMIRLLSNLETDQEKLIQILLVGQPELEMELAAHDLRQLRSRLAKHVRLNALSLQESLDYTAFRFSVASKVSSEYVINQPAGKLLWQASQGIPRGMHIILDRCLYGLMHRGVKIIDSAMMAQAIADAQILLRGLSSTIDKPMIASPAYDSAHDRSKQYQFAPIMVGAVIGTFGLVFSAIWLTQKSSLDAKQMSIAQSSTNVPIAAVASIAASEAKHTQTSKISHAEITTATAAMISTPLPIANFAAECSDQMGVSIFPNASDPLQLARLTPQTWALVGERLGSSVKTCFDSRQKQYQIAWHAPSVPIVFPAGREVAKYQIGLSNFGSLAASEVDGILGAKTTESIRLLQTRIGIEPSGRLDPLTALVLNKVYLN